VVAASQLLKETLLVAVRAAARIEPRVRDEPCAEERTFARASQIAHHTSRTTCTPMSTCTRVRKQMRSRATAVPTAAGTQAHASILNREAARKHSLPARIAPPTSVVSDHELLCSCAAVQLRCCASCAAQLFTGHSNPASPLRAGAPHPCCCNRPALHKMRRATHGLTVEVERRRLGHCVVSAAELAVHGRRSLAFVRHHQHRANDNRSGNSRHQRTLGVKRTARCRCTLHRGHRRSSSVSRRHPLGVRLKSISRLPTKTGLVRL